MLDIVRTVVVQILCFAQQVASTNHTTTLAFPIHASSSINAYRTTTRTTGLWSFSRYPNYCGEMAAWWGMFIASLPALTSPWTYAASLASPLFVTYLLTCVSGIPLQEKQARTTLPCVSKDPQETSYDCHRCSRFCYIQRWLRVELSSPQNMAETNSTLTTRLKPQNP